MSRPPAELISAAHPRRPAWVLFFISSARVAGPGIVAGAAAQALRLPPLSGGIGWVAAWVGVLLPRGTMAYIPNGTHAVCGPLDAPWGLLYYWYAQPPVWLAYAATFVAARVMLCLTARWAISGERPSAGRFLGSWADVRATLGWALGAACLWQFYWGLRHGMMTVGMEQVPVLLGAGSCGLVWLGAAAGYLHTARRALSRQDRRHSDGAPGCARCGYPIGAAVVCPECGQDRTKRVTRTAWQRLSRVASRHGPLTGATVLLAWPYLVPLIAAALPADWVVFIASHMPLWW